MKAQRRKQAEPVAPTVQAETSPGRKVIGLLAGWPAVVVLLAAFWWLATSSAADKCNTYDELAHLTAGYTYLAMGDYRINPANINLSQVIAAIPLVWGDVHFSPADQEEWRTKPNIWYFGHQFFYLQGNDVPSMLWRARAMIALVGCLLALTVYLLARKLFGRGGGLISLAMFAFCPAMLANGALVTTDMAASLTFLLSSWCFWKALNKVTPWTILAAGLSLGALALSKMTGAFFVFIAMGLIAVRLIPRRPLTVSFFRTWQVSGRLKQAGVFLICLAAQAAIVTVVIWAMFGFRYSSYSPKLGDYTARETLWNEALSKGGPAASCFSFARDHRLLPEAYLYSLASILPDVQMRRSFLNGEYSLYGWRIFFPYVFMVKTPLTLLWVVLLSAVAAAVKWRQAARLAGGRWTAVIGRSLYATAPLWMLLTVYWLGAILSNLNIGHRHILPVYAPMIVLAGGAAYWLARKAGRVRAVAGATVIVALAALAGETGYRWPNYIAYFNQLIGGPANGYKHLVDSSLDWGQDLPALKKWLDQQGLSDQHKTPVYLCYFGTASPKYYGINAQKVVGFIELESAGVPVPVIMGGYYCVSATMLRSVVNDPFGPWTAAMEEQYLSSAAAILPFLQVDPTQAKQMLAGPSGEQYKNSLIAFCRYAQRRLMAYLRGREPIGQINHSILIYHLTDQEAIDALSKPLPVQ